MTRPNTYHDWRKLYKQLCLHLGYHINFNINQGRPLMDRYTWKLNSQIKRVQLRMHVEAEALTVSYCQAVWEMVTGN